MPATFFFDLDDTLYRPESGVMDAISRRITTFVIRRFGKTEAEAERLRAHWSKTYGTAFRGMREEGYPFDPDSYFAFVHDIPLDRILPVPAVHGMLMSLNARRLVLTNADANHAWRVLWRLGLEDCFERVIDIKAMGFVNKPHREAFARVEALTGAQAGDCTLIDDLPANTRGAMAAGWRAILVSDSGGAEDAHGVAADVEDAIGQLRRAAR